jgi:hypothetical protein
MCRFSDAGIARLSTHSGGRRLKSAKAGNRGGWGTRRCRGLTAGALGNVPTTWSIAPVGDYNGDGNSDLLWRDTSGNTSIWFMNGTSVTSTGIVGNVPTNWTVQSVNAESYEATRR